MNILITGASGNVGLKTVEQLLQADKKISITCFDLPNRFVKKKLKKYTDKVSVFYGDIANYNDVEQVCKNKDVVIHLAAIIPPLADDKPDLAEKVNVDGTQNIIKALKKYSPNAMLIYSSSISVYGDRLKNTHIKIGDKLLPSQGDEYAKTKIEAEKIITESGLNWSIFRLTAIFGINNHKIGKIMFHMPLETPIEFATAEDTGRAFANAVFETEKLKGQIFNLSGGENCRITYKQFLQKSFNIFGLGDMKFPKIAFASMNFHCAYYDDGDVLDEILHFRRDTTSSYFKKVQNNVSSLKYFITHINRLLINKILVKKSEPLNAVRNGNKTDLFRFFGKSISTEMFVK